MRLKVQISIIVVPVAIHVYVAATEVTLAGLK